MCEMFSFYNQIWDASSHLFPMQQNTVPELLLQQPLLVGSWRLCTHIIASVPENIVSTPEKEKETTTMYQKDAPTTFSFSLNSSSGAVTQRYMYTRSRQNEVKGESAAIHAP